MSIKSCLRVLPSLLRQVKQQSLFTQQKEFCTKLGFLTAQNLCGDSHRRQFFKDASQHEVFGEDRIRVYYGTLTPQIRTVKWFSLTTSLAGLISQPIIYKELSQLDNIPLLVVGCTFVGFFTFATPFLLHFITKKYITHLDYNTKKDTYIASTVNFFCMLKETEFKTDEVKVPDVPGMFTTFIAKGKPMFMEARSFQDPSHYAKIMGYDKPIDFKMFQSPVEDDEKTSKK